MDSIPSSISVKEVDAGAAQSTVIRSASHEPPPHTPTIYHDMQQTSAALPILQPCVLTSDVAPSDLIGACNVKKIESTRTPQSKAWPRMLPEDRSISEVQDLNLQTLLSSSAPQDSHPTYRLHPVPLIFTNAEYPKIRDRIEQEIATQTSSLRNGGSYSFSLPSLDEVNDFYLKNPHLDEEHVLESKYVSELEIPERMIVRLQMLQFPFVRDILECETPHAELDSCLQHAANINLQTGDYANRVRQEINSLREKVRAQHVEILETTRGIIRLEQDVSRRNEGITENSANRATRDDKSVLESLVKQIEKGGSINGVLRRRVKECARKLDRQSEDMLRNLETSKQYSCAGPSHLEQRHMKAGDGFDGSTSFKEDKGDGNPPCGPTNPMASTLGSIRAYLDLRRKVHILALLEHLTLS